MGNLSYRVGALTLLFLLSATLSKAQLISKVQPTPSHESDSSASTFNEPDGFMGVPFGSSQDVLYQRLGLKPRDCMLKSNAPSGIDQTCTIDVPMGVIASRASFHYRGYPQGVLLHVLLTFDSKDYEAIEEIFITRYGNPIYRDTKGLFWRGSRSIIRLQRAGALIGGSEYLDRVKSEIRKEKESIKESIKKGVEILQ